MTNGSTDLRRAFDGLTRTIESVGERLRSLQRERSMLLERIDEYEDQARKREERILAAEQQREALERSVEELREELEAATAESVDSDEMEALRARAAELEETLKQKGEQGSLREKEWEDRIAAAERDRDQAQRSADELLRERDQARATVESMLVKVRQLESADDESTRVLERKVKELGSDLEEALKLAEAKEAEANELRSQLQAASVEGEGVYLSAEEQEELAQSVSSALELIDRHLGDRAET